MYAGTAGEFEIEQPNYDDRGDCLIPAVLQPIWIAYIPSTTGVPDLTKGKRTTSQTAVAQTSNDATEI